MIPLAYTIAPFLAAMVGGAITAYRPPSAPLKSIVQHFAAGVVFAAAGVEILPDVIHAGAPVAALIGSIMGAAAMVSLRSVEGRLAGPVGLAITSAVDVFIDGFVLGLSFLHGTKQGIVLTLALTLELLFLGLSVAASLGTSSKVKIVLATVALAVFLPIGTVVGLLLHGLPEHLLAGFYAFGLMALLYLVTEELLTEAHQIEDTALMPAAFFSGFIVLLCLEELL